MQARAGGVAPKERSENSSGVAPKETNESATLPSRPPTRKREFMVASNGDNLLQEYDKILHDFRDSVIVSADFKNVNFEDSAPSLNAADLPATVEEEGSEEEEDDEKDDKNNTEDGGNIKGEATSSKEFNKSEPALSSSEFEKAHHLISEDVFDSYDKILHDFRDSSRMSFTIQQTKELHWEA
mmetsp:Transcript_21965/g.50602  ORF Transcript_21965/g.50602 Transcript_21965/m.50602 type:complete len:183 (+) Transcript_21965:723-1271(+)